MIDIEISSLDWRNLVQLILEIFGNIYEEKLEISENFWNTFRKIWRNFSIHLNIKGCRRILKKLKKILET